jgi:hypothetical protein
MLTKYFVFLSIALNAREGTGRDKQKGFLGRDA